MASRWQHTLINLPTHPKSAWKTLPPIINLTLVNPDLRPNLTPAQRPGQTIRNIYKLSSGPIASVPKFTGSAPEHWTGKPHASQSKYSLSPC